MRFPKSFEANPSDEKFESLMDKLSLQVFDLWHDGSTSGIFSHEANDDWHSWMDSWYSTVVVDVISSDHTKQQVLSVQNWANRTELLWEQFISHMFTMYNLSSTASNHMVIFSNRILIEIICLRYNSQWNTHPFLFDNNP